MKQTAVEWLFEQLDVVDSSINYEYFKQAKEMEKQQQGYSEEEVLEMLQDFANDLSDNVININFWFERFKKK